MIADEFRNDPRLAAARRLVREALAEHQQRLAGPHAPAADRAADYGAMLEQFGELRGGNLYFPFLGSGLGRGPLVELADGSVKYDMITGIGVHAGGHGNSLWVEAALDAALSDTVMQGHLQQNRESFELVQSFVALARDDGADFAHCVLTTSGAMANENALKLAFARHHPASRLLAFEHCFMGRTTTLAQITDKPAYRAGLPATVCVDYLPFFDPAAPGPSIERAVTALKSHLARYPAQHAAMCFELVQGEGGYYPGDRDFFLALFDVLRAHDVAVLVDEVQTFGRTTRPFAFGHFDLGPHVDIATVGKMTQVCATLFRADYRPPRGLISQTFTGSGSSIFVARALLDRIRQGGDFGPEGRIQRIHERFAGHFERLADAMPGVVSGPFGLGGMIAFTPFDGTADAATRTVRALYDDGVMTFLAGASPSRVRMLPPLFGMEMDDVDAVAAIIERTMANLAG
ncbi:MAG: acetylornithine aminotransferase [Phycisphaeraceae bacterium]|nr:acetylornithine aminotransferase [Phycisphaeraceae bacterium]